MKLTVILGALLLCLTIQLHATSEEDLQDAFKGNWTKSYPLKNGETLTHTPMHIAWGLLHLSSFNLNGSDLHVDSTQQEFESALRNTMMWRDDSAPIGFKPAGDWTESYPLTAGDTIFILKHTPEGIFLNDVFTGSPFSMRSGDHKKSFRVQANWTQERFEQALRDSGFWSGDIEEPGSEHHTLTYKAHQE